MFVPEPPNDLVLPSRDSTTGRAIASLSRRALFERTKTLHTPAEGDPRAREAYTRLREVLVGFLPGDPHVISRMVGKPTVGAGLRRLRDGLGGVDAALAEVAAQGLFALACEGRLPTKIAIDVAVPTLVHLGTRRAFAIPDGGPIVFDGGDVFAPGAHAITAVLPVEGPLGVLAASDPVQRFAGRHGAVPSDEDVRLLREGLSIVRSLAPAMRTDLDRFVHAIVLRDDGAPAHALEPWAIGTAFLPRPRDAFETALDLASALVAQKVHSLREHDALVPDAALAPLVDLSITLVRAALAHVRGVRAGDSNAAGPNDLASEVRGRIALVLGAASPTPVGAGWIAELGRIADELEREERR